MEKSFVFLGLVRAQRLQRYRPLVKLVQQALPARRHRLVGPKHAIFTNKLGEVGNRHDLRMRMHVYVAEPKVARILSGVDGADTEAVENSPCLPTLGGSGFCWRRVSQLRGGEGGIRTHGTVAGTPHFECGAFDLSATSPQDQDAAVRPTGRLVAGAL